jgi:hypothetical protein
MKTNNLEKLDLSFLPENLAEQTRNRLELALGGLEKIKWPIRAVILAGGYKHKEIAYTDDQVGSDIDLFIFSNFIPFFWKKLVKIQEEINKNNFFFHYRGVIPLFLFKSRTFWAYKLKNEGIVLKGDENILKKIRAKENNIPKIEAIRILFQTIVVWLKKGEEFLSTEFILRSYLNIGESYLTFFGCLKSSYKERMEEFKKRFQEFEIEEELAEKIILGYLTKINPDKAKIESQNYQLSLVQAKKDCLKAIDNLLSLYLKTDAILVEKIDVLGKKIKPKRLFNFAFFLFLRDLKEVKPKFFPIVFKFKITDLWKITVYNELEEIQKRDHLLKKYFFIKDFSNKTLIKIFESHPGFSLIEIS